MQATRTRLAKATTAGAITQVAMCIDAILSRDQAIDFDLIFFLRQVANPIPANPISSIAHVEGSGTGLTLMRPTLPPRLSQWVPNLI
jgi:hypothetical protein